MVASGSVIPMTSCFHSMFCKYWTCNSWDHVQHCARTSQSTRLAMGYFCPPEPVPLIRKLPQASYPSPSEGRQNENHNHRKLTKLITRITALSNSMKLWAMLCRATQDRLVMVENSDKMWSTGEDNGKPFSILPWEAHEKYEKGRRYNTERRTSQVSRCPICYWRTLEKQLQKEWRGWAKAKTTPSCGCDWWWK